MKKKFLALGLMTAVFLSSFNTFGFQERPVVRAEEIFDKEIVPQPEDVSNERTAAEPEESRQTNADTVPGDTNQVLDNLPVNGDTTGVNNQTTPTEDFLAGLTIEPLGRKLVIKNVNPELVGKLEACKFYIKSDSDYEADAGGNRTILKPINDNKDLLITGFKCDESDANYLHIQSKDNKVFKAFGPFYRSYNEFWGSNDFMGWDIEKEAIIGVPDAYEYATYKEEDSFDEDKVEWHPCSGEDISIPKYSNTKKLSYAFRKKAYSNYFSSDIVTVSDWDINYDLGSEISDGGDRFEKFRGIYWKVAVFGKNEPTAVVDFTEYVRRGGSFDNIEIYIGRDDNSISEKYKPIPSEVYEGKNPLTDTYILERPIKEGESIFLSLDGKIRGSGEYGFVEEEALSHLDISQDGKWLEFTDSLHNTEYEYCIDNLDYVRATRRRVKTGFDGTKPVTVKVRGRNWSRITKREWIKTISNNTLDSEELKDLKGRDIRVNLDSYTVSVEKFKVDHYKEALPEVQNPKVSELSYLFGENGNGNYTSFDNLKLEDDKYIIKLPVSLSDELKGKKLFIKKGSAVITISFHDFHPENKIVPKKIIGINEIGPITEFTLIKEKNSDDDFVRPGSSEKYAHTTRHGKGYAVVEKNDATYILKNRPYTDDGYRKIFFDLRPGESNIWYKRFDQTDYPIYIWNDVFEVNMAGEPDDVKIIKEKPVPLSQDSGNVGSGSTGGGNAGSTGGGSLGSGSTGGSENPDKNSQNKTDDSKVTDNKEKADDKAKTGNTDNKNKEGDAKAKDNQTNKEADKPKAVKTTNTSINNVSASEKKVLQVLKNDSARLENVMSTGKVTISHDTLKNIFKDKAGELKTTLKVSAPKKDEWKETLEKSSFKEHTNYKPISKQVINFSLKADNHEVKKKELGKTRIKVVVDIDLKKAPKEVFVMNVVTGEIVKATYNSALNKLTFKAKDVGKFVVLNKVKGKTRVKSGGKGKKKKD